MNDSIYKELIERYRQTGKIGFVKPKNEEEALSIIESLTTLYEEEPEEVAISLSEISDKLKEFFNKF